MMDDPMPVLLALVMVAVVGCLFGVGIGEGRTREACVAECVCPMKEVAPWR